MGMLDMTAFALRLNSLEDPESAADIIDDMMFASLSNVPKSPSDCINLIDLVVSGLERDRQPRNDFADRKALNAVKDYLFSL